MKSILDRSFKYTPSAKTDLGKTFAKLRREQRAIHKTGRATDAGAMFCLLKRAALQSKHIGFQCGVRLAPN
jgi:hypothetical protein